MSSVLRSIWSYRFFILSSIKNDLRARFTRSKLGGLWMVIHPLAQVLIFALILSEVLSAKLPGVDNKYAYALYLMAGMLFWTLFAETIQRCLTLFIDNANLMKKMAFPRLCLPIIAAGTMLVNNVLLCAAIFGVFAALGHFPDANVIWLPVLVLMTLALAMSLGTLLGVINVFMRDLGQVIPVVLNALFWLTPWSTTSTRCPRATRRGSSSTPVCAGHQLSERACLRQAAAVGPAGWIGAGHGPAGRCCIVDVPQVQR